MAEFVTLRLTLDECTSLMHALEVAKDEAYKARLLHDAPRSPNHLRFRPEEEEKMRNAAGDTYLRVTELCDYVTGVWEESMAEARHTLDLQADWRSSRGVR